MSDNLTNLIKSALFSAGVTVTTSGGDIAPTVIQPAQMTGQEKYNLDQRDSLSVLLFSDLGTITAGATITAKYYARFPNAINDEKLLSTETITAPAITVGNHYVARFSGENLVNCDADYFTITVVLKQAVGSSYTATGQVVVKKKIVKEPLANQPIPTTTTTGTVGDVVIDTNGDSHTLVRVESGVYYWSSPKLRRMPFFMNAGLFDFSAKNLKNRKWYFPNGSTSTAERPAVTLTSAGVVELEGDWENSYQVEINRNTTTTQYVGRLKDLYLAGYYLSLTACNQVTGTLADAPRVSYFLSLADCTQVTGLLADAPRVSYSLILINCNQITGSLADAPRVSYSLILSGCTLITGSLIDLPRVSYLLNLSGCTLITGSLADAPRVSRYLDLSNCSLITGSLADAPRVDYYFNLLNCSLITGSLADAPRINYRLDLSNCSLITGSLPLNTIATIIYIGKTGCSKAEVDQSLANLVAGHPSMSGAKTLVLTGLKRTSASSANVVILISRGWSITDATIEG